MFVRRGRQVYLRTAPGGPEPITGEPIPPSVDPVVKPPAPTPPKGEPAPAPVAFDPSTLAPEVQAYLRAQEQAIATREGGKARDVARENAKAETLAKIAEALGIKPAEVDPAQVAQELTAARAEARSLKINRAVDIAAREVKADGDIVAALLAHQGKLTDLDPAASDFGDKVKTLVTELAKNNPRVLLDTVTPAGASAPVNGGFGGSPTGGVWPSMMDAVRQRLGG